MNDTIYNIRCVLQVALLGAVTSNLRAVTVTILPNKLMLNFYYENKPTENEIDLSQVASTEVLSDFNNLYVEELQITLHQQEPIPLKNNDLLIYCRYEGYPLNKKIILFKDISTLSISVASQIALLGAVTNNLRAVLIGFIEKKI